MERQLIDESTIAEVALTQPNAADKSGSGADSWEYRAEDCLRDLWRFFNRKVIDLHNAGRMDEAAELSDVREQVHALLSERPQQNVATQGSHLNHPITQLAEGSGLPASDDPDSFMPSLP